MSEAGHSTVAGLAADASPDDSAAVEPLPDYAAVIAGLRVAGGERLDPLRLHYLERLSARAQTQTGAVQRILEAKLSQAIAEFKLRLEQARSTADATAASASAEAEAQAPTAVAAPARESLGDLVRSIAHHAPEPGAATSGDTSGTRTELKSVRQFRNTWSKLSADKQVAKALVQAPKNAGPINSHMLVLRSLALMREISPDYLNRFMTYADSLLCLEQHEQTKYALPAKATNSEASKKPKPARRAKAK
jgi:hypothetical protein